MHVNPDLARLGYYMSIQLGNGVTAKLDQEPSLSRVAIGANSSVLFVFELGGAIDGQMLITMDHQPLQGTSRNAWKKLSILRMEIKMNVSHRLLPRIYRGAA